MADEILKNNNKKKVNKKQADKPEGAISVLVVEDDEFLRNIVSRKLSSEGFKVIEAIDAQAALEALKEKKPQVVLLDLILPGMDGFSFLERIRKDEYLRDIPVVVLSNLGQEEDRKRAKELGAEDYLVKANYTPAEIVQRVRDVIKKTYL